MRRAFTLLEIMVACMLLSMLLTVLTMIFNQSSIAWRTGTSGVVNLQQAREDYGEVHDLCDELLPRMARENDMMYRTISFWREGEFKSQAKNRAWEQVTTPFSYDDAIKGRMVRLTGSGQGQSANQFSIGVRSAGPDRAFNTEDDITSLPENVK